MSHANTATAIRRLTVAVPKVTESAKSWERALQGAATTAIDGGLRLQLGGHAVDLLEAATAARLYGVRAPDRPKAVAIEFAVADVGKCRAALARGGVPAWAHGERTAVAAAHACGVVVILAPAGSPLRLSRAVMSVCVPAG